MNYVKFFIPKNWCADICKSHFLLSSLNFTLKTVLLSNAISSFFLGMVYIFTLQKIVTQRGRIYPFFTFIFILVKFSALKSSIFFLLKNWDTRNSKRATNINWWIFWMRNGVLLWPFFAPFYSRAALNT